jgi:hypothetical protein
MSEDRRTTVILVVSILLILVGAAMLPSARANWNTATLGIAFFSAGVGLFLGFLATR